MNGNGENTMEKNKIFTQSHRVFKNQQILKSLSINEVIFKTQSFENLRAFSNRRDLKISEHFQIAEI